MATPSIPLQKLNYLLPSDLDKIKAAASTHTGAREVLDIFATYLATLKKPRAVELDDVTRIALQLNSIGLWDDVKPEFFLRHIRSLIDSDVLETVRDALKVDRQMEDASSQKSWTKDLQEIVHKLTPSDLRSSTDPVVKHHAAESHAHVAKRLTTTVTLKHLAASLAEDNEISKRQAEAILGGLVGNIVEHLKKGDRLRIGGLGVLQVRKRAARMGRNPATGKVIKIKEGSRVAFSASKELKKEVI